MRASRLRCYYNDFYEICYVDFYELRCDTALRFLLQTGSLIVCAEPSYNLRNGRKAYMKQP